MTYTVAFLGGTTGGSEMLLILVAALLLFGSKNLPRIARTIGKTMEDFRRAARDVKDEILRAEEEEPAPDKEDRAALRPATRPKEGPDEPVARG